MPTIETFATVGDRIKYWIKGEKRYTTPLRFELPKNPSYRRILHRHDFRTATLSDEYATRVLARYQRWLEHALTPKPEASTKTPKTRKSAVPRTRKKAPVSQQEGAQKLCKA